MEVVDREFKDEQVRLDFREFVRCRFENCQFIYSAFGPVTFVGCTFIDVRWSFIDAAGTMLAFLHGMYIGAGEGGQEFVEQVFDSVRRGSKGAEDNKSQ